MAKPRQTDREDRGGAAKGHGEPVDGHLGAERRHVRAAAEDQIDVQLADDEHGLYVTRPLNHAGLRDMANGR